MKKERGITLVALVVTIIVLLVLAAVTLNLVLGQNGIITKATDAKIEGEVSYEKEQISLAVSSAKMEKIKNGDNTVISSEELQKELDNQMKSGKVRVAGNGSLTVEYIESGRSYEVNDNGYISEDVIIKAEDPTPGVMEGEGTQENPYQINSVEDLVAFSKTASEGNKYEGKYVKLMRNLDFNSVLSYIEPNNTELFGDYNGDGVTEGIKAEVTKKEANGFKAIHNFYGIFLGNNKKINNVYQMTEVNNSDYLHRGMFEKNCGTIQDLKVGGVFKMINTATGDINADIGAIVGNNEGIIINCSDFSDIRIDSTVYGTDKYYQIGGLVGDNEGIIKNCRNSGTINVTGTINIQVGGIAGINKKDAGIIEDCENNKQIKINTNGNKNIDRTVPDTYVGGIVGDTYTKLINCVNKGKVEVNASSYATVGGIAGNNRNEVSNSYNEANIEASSSYKLKVAGVIGDDSLTSIVTNVYNTGNITGVHTGTEEYVFAAGISGEGIGTIKNAYNMGTITGQSTTRARAGGITAECNGSITNAYNVGKVNGIGEGKIRIGGITGDGNGTIANVYNKANLKGEATGTLAIGGIIGDCTATISKAYNIGKIEYTPTTNNYIGGIVGDKHSSMTVTECYYLTGTAEGGIEGKDIIGSAEAKEDLTAEVLLNYLNDYVIANPDQGLKSWKITDENQKYPIFD